MDIKELNEFMRDHGFCNTNNEEDLPKKYVCDLVESALDEQSHIDWEVLIKEFKKIAEQMKVPNDGYSQSNNSGRLNGGMTSCGEKSPEANNISQMDLSEDMMIRASRKSGITKEDLMNTFTEKGLIGVYNLGLKSMLDYLNDNRNLDTQKDNGWISCSERLPEAKSKRFGSKQQRTSVLATLKNGTVKEMLFEFSTQEFWEAGDDNPISHWQEDCTDDDTGVIAWQPLPEPYKENEQ